MVKPTLAKQLIDSEKLFALKDFNRHAAGLCKPVAPSTFWRWTSRGLLMSDGTRLRLELTYIGTTPMTSREAVGRFFAAITADRMARRDRPRAASPECSPQELAAAGL